MASNIAISITADVADLVAKRAVMSAVIEMAILEAMRDPVANGVRG